MSTTSLPVRLGATLLLLIALAALAVAANGSGSDAWAADDAGRCRPQAVNCVDTIGGEEPTFHGDIDADIAWTPIQVEPGIDGPRSLPSGTFVDAAGSQVTVGFWMGVESCHAVTSVEVHEGDERVSIDISVTQRPGVDACIEIAQARSVTVTLDAPLGDRTLEIGGIPARG